MATNDFGVEVTPELVAEGEAIERALDDLRGRYDAWLEQLDVPIGEGHGSFSLEGACEDVAADITRFTDTGEE